MWRWIDKLPEAMSKRMDDFYDCIKKTPKLDRSQSSTAPKSTNDSSRQLFQRRLFVTAYRLNSPAEVCFASLGSCPSPGLSFNPPSDVSFSLT